MKYKSCGIPGLKYYQPTIHDDSRGYFFEAFNERNFEKEIGREVNFVQDNVSNSSKNCLRGLHYQLRKPQGKLIYVTEGEIFDVAVDLRIDSPSFGQWFSIKISKQNKIVFWVPEGFAHGFLALSDHVNVIYKVTDYYAALDEHCLRWDDPQININWPLTGQPTISEKDGKGRYFRELPYFN